MRAAGAALAALALAAAVVAIDAAPAAAHGAGGLDATNYETRVLSVSPRVDGVSVRAVDLGDRLELTNTTGTPIVVLGYQDEPYLRVGPRGVFENIRSPARYLNRERRSFGDVPSSADEAAEPVWRRTGAGPTVRWHDHRAHWMGSDDPPAVRNDRGATRAVQQFTIELIHGPDTIRVVGDVRWVPGPSPWPWVGVALAIAAAIVLAGRTRRVAPAIGSGLVVLVGAQALHVAGLWGGTTESFGSRLAASAYSIGGVALAVVAFVVLLRRGTYAGAPLALLAGLFLLLSGGLADVTVLGRSQVPSTLPAWVDRATVALTLGAGAGLVIVGIRRLWRAEPIVRAAPTAGAPSAADVPPEMEARYRSPAG